LNDRVGGQLERACMALEGRGGAPRPQYGPAAPNGTEKAQSEADGPRSTRPVLQPIYADGRRRGRDSRQISSCRTVCHRRYERPTRGPGWPTRAGSDRLTLVANSTPPLPHVWPVQPAVQQGQVVPAEWSSGDRPRCIWPARLFKGTHSDSYRVVGFRQCLTRAVTVTPFLEPINKSSKDTVFTALGVAVVRRLRGGVDR
jgi:hypothetical protein